MTLDQVKSDLKEIQYYYAKQKELDGASRTIKSLKEIAEECKSAVIPIYDKDGELIKEKVDAASRGVAVKAIDTAAKLLGYNAPQKMEVSGTIQVPENIAELTTEELRAIAGITVPECTETTEYAEEHE